jgi:arylformamidase
MLIYKKYNQEQLDLQYNNRYHVPDFETSLTRWETLSRLAEEKYRILKNIPYGTLSRETLDVFPSDHSHAKTLVFIHGGYWHLFDKASFYFIADAFARYGITTVVINYPLAPASSIDQIVTSCRKALSWLYENLGELHGDAEQIYVVGHSAGGHLAAMLMTSGDSPGNRNVAKGVCTLSGVFNLMPIQLSGLNGVLQMDNTVAIRNSPFQLSPDESCPLIIAVGREETDEFRNQSEELYRSWENKSRSITHMEIPALNHFTILDSLHDVDSAAHKAICKLMDV